MQHVKKLRNKADCRRETFLCNGPAQAAEHRAFWIQGSPNAATLSLGLYFLLSTRSLSDVSAGQDLRGLVYIFTRFGRSSDALQDPFENYQMLFPRKLHIELFQMLRLNQPQRLEPVKRKTKIQWKKPKKQGKTKKKQMRFILQLFSSCRQRRCWNALTQRNGTKGRGLDVERKVTWPRLRRRDFSLLRKTNWTKIEET